MGKLVLLLLSRTLPENANWCVLGSVRFAVCRIIRFGDKTIHNPIKEEMFQLDWIPGWECALHRHAHDSVEKKLSWTKPWQVLHKVNSGPGAFSILLDKLDRTVGSKLNTDILDRIQSFSVAYGTTFSKYLPTYRFHVTDFMPSDPVKRPLVGGVVTAVRDNPHRHFYALRLQLFTGATANNRYLTSLHQLWQHLETCLYTNVLATPSPIHDGKAKSAKPNSYGPSSINVVKGPARHLTTPSPVRLILGPKKITCSARCGRWQRRLL